ncbi:MAG: hypothetical protein GF331_06175 [Chitinivibrionales bacterium]|nr:hypothetical protein [Chitinivibrionales bacterium]
MARRQLPEDFKEFIRYLNSNEVRYLLIGGWAVGLHGFPRATKDIDFLIAVDPKNLERITRALADFGGPAAEAEHLTKPGSVFRMGAPPLQIDIINQAAGLQFDDCYARRDTIRVNDLEIAVISKEDLIRNKKATGRTQDRADAERLG